MWLPTMKPNTCKYYFCFSFVLLRGFNTNDYFICNRFLKQDLDFYDSSLKIISVMKYYGLEEPDYQEVTHNFLVQATSMLGVNQIYAKETLQESETICRKYCSSCQWFWWQLR